MRRQEPPPRLAPVEDAGKQRGTLNSPSARTPCFWLEASSGRSVALGVIVCGGDPKQVTEDEQGAEAEGEAPGLSVLDGVEDTSDNVAEQQVWPLHDVPTVPA